MLFIPGHLTGDYLYKRIEKPGSVGGNPHKTVGDGVNETEPVCVEAKPFGGFSVPVFGIPRHRTSQMSGRLHPYLILAAGLKIESHQ